MLTFLKKAGQIILEAGQIALGFGPVIQTMYPSTQNVVAKATSDLQGLGQVIITVEAIGQALNLSGTQKLSAAAPLIAQAILQTDLMIGHKIQDPATYNKGAQEIAQGLVDIYNSLHPAAAQSTNLVVAPNA